VLFSITLHFKPENAQALFATAADAPPELWPVVARRWVGNRPCREGVDWCVGWKCLVLAAQPHEAEFAHESARRPTAGSIFPGPTAIRTRPPPATLLPLPPAAWPPPRRSARCCSSCGTPLCRGWPQFGEKLPHFHLDTSAEWVFACLHTSKQAWPRFGE